ncbi:Lrp/AsnC family transcriptional regulator [Companilactobacillus zhongbaensis]|uniref:Lrp/AsnC family transcriptional regulator n=1 Tax=Companilactobacillus zhongbaensis TaxID=2486009 RepID=UPI000F786736|nr:Lrp/AsnC family transcriptional regulator [Companilactobacillus zhongbaensis]
MNDIDQKILNYLQSNGRLSIKKLSEALFITAPAVSQQLKKLEENGYIKSYNAHLNFEKLGLKIKAFIQLEVSPDQKPEFYKYVDSIPNVIECDCITGPYSMILQAVFKSTEDLDDLINELHKFGRTSTQIVFSTPVENRGFYLK